MYNIICTQEVLDTKLTSTQVDTPRATIIKDNGWSSELKGLFDLTSTQVAEAK